MGWAHTTDPFLVTADWLRTVSAVWQRDNCLICGQPFRVGERVRWLHPDYPGAGTDYRITHADCVDPELWPPDGR